MQENCCCCCGFGCSCCIRCFIVIDILVLSSIVGHRILALTLSSSAFEKGRKVWGGGLSAQVRKSIKELSETPCCYLEF